MQITNRRDRAAFQSASQIGCGRILELVDQRHMAAVEPGCIGAIRDFALELNGKLRRKLLI